MCLLVLTGGVYGWMETQMKRTCLLVLAYVCVMQERKRQECEGKCRLTVEEGQRESVCVCVCLSVCVCVARCTAAHNQQRKVAKTKSEA